MIGSVLKKLMAILLATVFIFSTTGDDKKELLKKLNTHKKQSLQLIEGGESSFSKIGGLPDVIKDFIWPEWKNRPLAFISQMKISELGIQQAFPFFPKRGLLYFFYNEEQETWGFDPKDQGSWKVVFIENEDQAVFPANKPEQLHTIFTEKKVVSKKILTYPSWEDETVFGSLFRDDKILDMYSERVERIYQDNPKHCIGGFAYPIQNYDMELECELTSNGFYLGDGKVYQNNDISVYKAKSKDWFLLAQIDTDDDCNMMWGDVGILYFWAKRTDIEKSDFSKVWMILQCY